jgi:hypothetical protein
MCRLIVFTAVLLFLAASNESTAQDIIVKQNGEEIKSKVVQVNDTLVKYKNFDDPEFITYDIAGSELKMIIFENGKKKIFGIDLARSYIGVAWGNFQPSGRYKDDDGAEPGKGLNIDGCFYMKNRKWGLGFEMGFFENGFNSSYIDQQLRNNLSGNEFITTSFGKFNGSWVAIGPQYSSKLNRWITWDVRYAAGLMNMSKPSLDYFYTDGGNINVIYKEEKGHGQSVMQSFNTGFRFNFTKRLALKLSIRLAGSNPIIKYGSEFSQTDSMGNLVSSGRVNDNKKQIGVFTMNGMAGLSYQFGTDRIKPDHRKMYGKIPHSYLEIIYGVSGPVGSFSNGDYRQSDAGLAKHGKFGSIDGCAYLKNRKWGLGLNLALSDNKFEDNEIDFQLKNSSNQNNGRIETSYGKYTSEWLAIGPQFSPKISKWLIWDLRLSAGIMGLSKPFLNYTYWDGSGNKLEYKLDHGFGLGIVKTFATSFRCYLTDRLALRLFIQAAAAQPIVKYNESVVQTNASGNVIFSNSKGQKKQVHYSTMNTALGLSYQF